MIGVIDYRAGNAPSVMYALERLGLDARLIAEPSRPRRRRPPDPPRRRRRPRHAGVAGGLRAHRAAARAASSTTTCRSSGSASASRCCSSTARKATVDGLGWLDGRRPPLPRGRPGPADRVEPRALHPRAPRHRRLPDSTYCYFVNSYYVVPTNPEDVLGVTDYGVEFCSVVARENLIATQFHAEKSGELGLRLLARLREPGTGTRC